MTINELIQDKKVLYIALKNIDYIRTTQIINIIKESRVSKYDCIYSDHKNLIRRLIDIRKQLWAMKLTDYDVIIIGFLPQLVFKYIKKRNRKALIVSDYFLSLFDTIVDDRRLLSSRNPISKYLFKLDKITLEKSDYVYTDTKCDLEYFISKFNATVKNGDVLYLTADTSIYDDVNVAHSKQDNKYKVLYFGTGLPLQGIDYIFDAIEEINTNDKYLENNITFDIIGNVGKRNRIIGERYINVNVYSWLNQKQLSEMIGQSDLCLAGHFSNSIGKAKRTIPGKAYIYDAMKKNMILGDSPANHELFEEDEKHHFVKMGNGTALAEIVYEQYRKEYK